MAKISSLNRLAKEEEEEETSPERRNLGHWGKKISRAKNPHNRGYKLRGPAFRLLSAMSLDYAALELGMMSPKKVFHARKIRLVVPSDRPILCDSSS